ncbi:hypothetical protein N431DRAFT_529531 [Stipitochalara longipes BDJ]|nr:hypothetical protein N431DRAFT_529531 [Stipitochalara longipes BDJ]
MVPKVTSAAIDTAQRDWVADTSVVSNFLSTTKSLSGTNLANAAQTALNAQNNELTQKAVLDDEFISVTNPNPTVQTANAVLINQGTFQFVVSGLQTLATNGTKMAAAQVSTLVESINVDICNKVLPAVDQYFIAAGKFLNNGLVLSPFRPTNCP